MIDQSEAIPFSSVVIGDIILLNGKDFGLGNVELGFGISAILEAEDEGRKYEVMHNGVAYGLFAKDDDIVVRYIPAESGIDS
ncbi:hypothetical protein [Gordonia sp. (in: high G+C Gram-positive bacteria)]|uniref:hypothetical protein n=1 Tax=Gordonia sp. (in: high G+C Gram-positive bacteria) TaxID=84139 RepID=UPI003F9741D7